MAAVGTSSAMSHSSASAQSNNNINSSSSSSSNGGGNGAIANGSSAGKKSSGFMKSLSRSFTRGASTRGSLEDVVADLPPTRRKEPNANASTAHAQRRRSTGGIAGLSGTPAQTRPAFGTVRTYKKLEKLGEGTYASVFRGISHVNGKIVALKEIRLEPEEGAPCTAIREVSLLKGLKHANIVTLHDIIHTRTSLTLVFEFLEKDLKAYMDECGSYIDLTNVKLFMFQLLRALGYCHAKKVLHRDLKPQNILINSAGELKLADFGLARAKSVPIKTYSNEVVTLWYRPPDVLLGSVDYSGDIDMWGVGCIFAEMVSGRPLLPGGTNEEQLGLIWRLLGSPDLSTWPEVEMLPEYSPEILGKHKSKNLGAMLPRLDKVGYHLLCELLTCNPRRRLSAQNSMKHPYFASLGQEIHGLAPTSPVFPASDEIYRMESELARQGRRRKQEKSRRQSVRF